MKGKAFAGGSSRSWTLVNFNNLPFYKSALRLSTFSCISLKNTLTILFFWINVLKITFTILGNKNQSLSITDYWCFINHWSYSCLWGKVNDNDDDDLGSLQRVLNVGEALATPTPSVRHLGTRRWQPWQLMSIWSWYFNNILSICQFRHDTININNWKWLFSDWE